MTKECIMATDVQSSFKWYSWLFLGLELVWSLGISLMTHKTIAPPSVRWIITAAFIGLTLTFGLIDFVLSSDSAGRDDTPVDRWTIVHTLAGVVFGIWLVPLIYVLMIVIMWECFEFSVAGFGDQEVIANRGVDIGVAVGGWLIVVVALMAINHVPFPLA